MLKLLFLYGCGFQQKKNPKLCFFKLLNVTLFFKILPSLLGLGTKTEFLPAWWNFCFFRRSEWVCSSHLSFSLCCGPLTGFQLRASLPLFSISNLEKSVGVRKWWFLYLDGTHAQRNPPPLCSWCASGFKDFKVVKQTGWRKTQRHTSSSNFIGCSFLQLKSVS